jgi:DivIVA domain-containing protein
VRPEDIESKEFLVSLRGYDKEQVREFLREVAAEYRKLAASQRDAEQPPQVATEPAQTTVESAGSTRLRRAMKAFLDTTG